LSAEGEKLGKILTLARGKSAEAEQVDELEKFGMRLLDAGYRAVLMVGLHEDGRLEAFDTCQDPGDMALIHRRVGYLLDEMLEEADRPGDVGP